MSVCLSIDTTSRSNCEKKYKKNGLLGKGAYGKVYDACIGSNCSYVLKVIVYDKKQYDYIGVDKLSRKHIMKQWKLEILSHIRIMKCEKKYNIINPLTRFAPKLYDAWYCDEENGDTTFYLLIEKYDGNLFHFINKYKNNKLSKSIIRLSLANLASSLYFIHNNCNICLNDIKLENILYKQNDDGYYDFSFGDFGLTSIAVNKSCKDEDLRRFNETINTFIDLL